MKRREFVRTAGGASAAVAASAGAAGTAAAQEERPDWPSDVAGANLGTYEDARGQDEVTVDVGAGSDGLAFDATQLWVDPGTTIVFEWTGSGGAHNVVTVEGPADLDSGDAVGTEGHTYEYEVTEEDAGITSYVCVPHEGVNMFGGIAVGDDIDTVETGGASTGWPENIAYVGVPLHAHWVGVAAILGIALTFVFTFYMLKYGESAHTGHGGSQ